MARYSSDCIVENMLTAEQLVEKWAICLHRNMNWGCNEVGYDIYIFKNGRKVWEVNYSTWDGNQLYGYETDEYWEHLEELQKLEQEDLEEIAKLHEQAKALAEAKQGKKTKRI